MHTAWEELAFLGFQTAWYWGHSFHGNEKFNWQNWSRRLTSYDDMVLDDDKFRTGAVGHPIAGTGYYLIARGNGFGVLASFAITVIASTTWQYFSEWNEKPATNDLLATPVAGWAIGEATYRLARYFIDREADARSADRFVLGVGTAHSAFDGGATMVALELEARAQLVTHPQYESPGSGRSIAAPGEWTTVSTEWLLGEQTISGVFFHADSIGVGDYRRRYHETLDDGKPDGRGRLLAIGSSYDYAARAIPVRWDRVMSVGIAGPMVELKVRHGQLELRAKAALYYGFAQVTSLAYVDLASSLSGEPIRTVLRKQGYYYAQALLPSAEVEARYGHLRATLGGRGGEYWSIDRDDSHQSQVTNRFSLRDTRLRTAASFGIQPDRGPFRFAFEFSENLWDSRLLGTRFTAREETVAATLLAAF